MPVLGLREFHDAVKKVGEQADVASRSAVSRMSALVEDSVKKQFQGAHKKGQPHTGPNRPNVVTGFLRRSVRSDPIEREGLATFATKVGPRAIYARAVEMGRRPGAAAYPSFQPGVEAVRGQFPEITAAEWRKFVRT